MVDLHMHSMYSDDGEFSPQELVNKCKAAGVTMMAIADHNCARANDEAEKAAKEAGILYIPAMEIDCTFKGTNLHVVGYGMEYHNAEITEIEKNIDIQSRRNSVYMLEATRNLGFDVTEEDMREVSTGYFWEKHWTGEMFAEVLLQKEEYKNHPLLKPYREGGRRSDNPYVNFYWDYYSQGKSCYVEFHYPSLKEIIDLIHKNHGIAVLAHPGVNLKNKESLLQEMIPLGLDGIEAFSSYHTEEQTGYFYDAAEKYNLLVTAGSDFHGKTKPSVSLGGYFSCIDKNSLFDLLREKFF